MRTCTGCRKVAPQRELIRLVFAGPRLAVDVDLGPGRSPGRGAYVHRNASCVTVAGLSRSFRRPVHPADVSRIVSEMSPMDDNSGDQPRQNAGQNAPGLADGDTVEMPPRIKATKKKDDRSEDARL